MCRAATGRGHHVHETALCRELPDAAEPALAGAVVFDVLAKEVARIIHEERMRVLARDDGLESQFVVELPHGVGLHVAKVDFTLPVKQNAPTRMGFSFGGTQHR